MPIRVDPDKRFRKGMLRRHATISRSLESIGRSKLEDAKDIMERHLYKFKFEGDLWNSLRIRTLTKSKRSVTLSLFSLSPYAGVMEFGTVRRSVYIGDKAKFKRWIRAKLGVDPTNWNTFTIGGTNSRIKRGASERKFFMPAIKAFDDDELHDMSKYIANIWAKNK